MLKSRFGGLFSVLNRQDMNTLYHFEAWAGDADLSPDPEFTTEDAIDRASVVIDCTPKGYGHKNKANYYTLRRTTFSEQSNKLS